MGKEHLAARHDLWSTHQLPIRSVVADLPDHPRLTDAHLALRQRSLGPRPFSFAMFRLVSPVVIPFAIGGASFVVLALLTISAPDPLPVSIGVELLGPLFFVYTALAVVLAAALAYAPNDTIWALVMVGGLIGYGTLTTWAVCGLPAALALVVGLVALATVVVRMQLHTVLESTVHVMVLFGKYNRTLYPGFNLRLPGEQVFKIILTGEETIDAQAQGITLLAGAQVDAMATASCHIVPERAHLATAHATDWPEEVRRCFVLALSEALTEMGPEEMLSTTNMLDAVLHDDTLTTRVRGHLQYLIGRWGISVEWVRIAAIRYSTSPEVQLVRSAAEPESQPTTQRSIRDHTPDVSGPVRSLPVVAQPDVSTAREATPAAILPLPAAMRGTISAPEALIEAYGAVSDGRITDPQTITRIALAFEKAAHDVVLGPHLPFDAQEAAKNLRILAAKRVLR